MSKQDRQGARTPADLERRYALGNLDKRFSEFMGMIDDTREGVDSMGSELRNEIRNTATSLTRDTEQIVLSAKQEVLEEVEGNYYTKEQSEARLTVKADEINSNVSATYATKTALNTTDSKAAAAQSAADAAQADADALAARVTKAETDISQTAEAITLRATKAEMQAAVGEVEQQVGDLSDNLESNYYTISEAEAAITVKANEITQQVSATYATQEALGTTLEKAEIAQLAADTAQSKADEATSAASAAQSTADQAALAAATAQSEADTAKANAATAQAKANEADAKAAQAASNLATAQQNLEAVTSRVGATEEEIAEAQEAVNAAQAAANTAKANAQAAQNTANTAVSNASTAQAKANEAASAASTAQSTANTAKAEAEAAQETADDAQAAAEAAQEAADNLATETDELQRELVNAVTRIEQTERGISQIAEKNYLVTEDLDGHIDTYVENHKSEFVQTAESAAIRLFQARLETAESKLAGIGADLEKHFDFTLEDGLIIRAAPNSKQLTLDNDEAYFSQGNQKESTWDGESFSAGNLYIANMGQFGNYAILAFEDDDADGLDFVGL